MKFKVGDKVEVIDGSYTRSNIGSKGIVLNIINSENIQVEFHEFGPKSTHKADVEIWMINIEHLKLIVSKKEESKNLADKGWGL